MYIVHRTLYNVQCTYLIIISILINSAYFISNLIMNLFINCLLHIYSYYNFIANNTHLFINYHHINVPIKLHKEI